MRCSVGLPRSGCARLLRMESLRRWNIGVGVTHLAQAVAIIALGNGFAIPVVAAVQTGPPGTPLVERATFFDLRFATAIARSGWPPISHPRI